MIPWWIFVLCSAELWITSRFLHVSQYPVTWRWSFKVRFSHLKGISSSALLSGSSLSASSVLSTRSHQQFSNGRKRSRACQQQYDCNSRRDTERMCLNPFLQRKNDITEMFAKIALTLGLILTLVIVCWPSGCFWIIPSIIDCQKIITRFNPRSQRCLVLSNQKTFSSPDL